MSIPIGWRFSPTHVETIIILASLNNGRSLPGIQVYQGYDVFGNLTPSELFRATASNTNNRDDTLGRYFYTRMTRLAKNGSNFKRTVEKINVKTGKLDCVGTWKGGPTAHQIFDPNTKALIGESRSYSFGESSSDRWLMTSFCLAGDALDIHPDSDVFAICRIHKKPPTKNRDGTLTISPNVYQPQPETISADPMTSAYCYQPQPQTAIVSPMMSPNYNQTQAQIVTANPTTSANYYQPQLQTVSVNLATESDVDKSKLYSQLNCDEEMEKIEAIVDNLSFSGMDEDMDSNLAEDEFDWIDELLAAEIN